MGQPQQQPMQPMQMQMMGQPNPQFGFSDPTQFSAPMQVGTGAPLQFGQQPQFDPPYGKS